MCGFFSGAFNLVPLVYIAVFVPVPYCLDDYSFALQLRSGKASLVAQLVKNPPGIPESPVRFLGQEDLLEKGQASHYSILFFPGCSAGKESNCNPRDLGLIPELGRSPEEGKATHSSILTWRNQWTVQSMESQTVNTTECLSFLLRSGSSVHLAAFFFLKITLAIQGVLYFHANCEFFCSLPVKNVIHNLIGIALNLQIGWYNITILEILIFQIQEHGICLCLCCL